MVLMLMRMMMMTTKMNHYCLGFTYLTLFLLCSVVTRCSALETGPLLLRRAGEANSVDSGTLLYVAPVCHDTGMSCTWECPWIPDGDYQWCGHCGYFLRCRQGKPRLIPCPRERPLWDNIAQKCQDYTRTCLCTSSKDDTTTTTTTSIETTATETQGPTIVTETQGPTVATETQGPTLATETQGPTVATETQGPTMATETQGPTMATETQGPTMATETQGPTMATETQGPTMATETQGPTIATETQGPTIATETQGPTVATETQGPTVVTETQGPTIATETQGPTVATETQGPTVVTETQGPTVATETQGPTIVTETQGSTTATETQGPTIATETQGPTIVTETKGPTIATETQGPTLNGTIGPTITETQGPTLNGTLGPTTTVTQGSTINGTTGPNITVTQGPTINGTIGPTITVTQGPTINGTIGPNITVTQEPTINGTIGPTITVTQGPTINGTIGPNITVTQEPTINGTIGPTITVTQGPTINGTIGPNITVTPEPTINGTTTETTVNTTETFTPPWNETSSNATEATNFTTVSSAPPTSTQNPADRDEYIEGTVYLDPSSGKLTYKLGKMDKKGTLYGFYNNTIHRTGWGVLEIKANALCKEDMLMPPFNVAGKMYAAGFLEGLLTARQIWEHYVNMKFMMYSSNATLNAAVKEFLERQDEWTRTMIEVQRRRRDPYWRNVEYVVNQLDGLHAGYKEIAKTQGWETDFHVVQMINVLGDLMDLRDALRKRSTTLERSPFNIGGRCSALIKLTPGFENIFIGHSTWFVYSSMLRIYKHYKFPFLRFTAGSIASSFSSYPGTLGSLDDFYLTDAGLGVMETTNGIFNTELYKKVIPESLFTWQRAIIANRMARTGKDWFYIFRMFNSGTYNNQFMIVDFKRVSLNKVVEDDALWIIEQIPGFVKGADQTSILRAGYWPSYNIPFYEEIYEKSGYDKLVSKVGTKWSYQLTPRAKIFRRDAGKIRNITEFMDLLRDNDYLNDEYSERNPGYAICSRYDLSIRFPFGCSDTKVADYNMSRALTSVVLSGPTTSHGLKPFSWRGKWENESHVGLPDTYDFPWIPMYPSLT